MKKTIIPIVLLMIVMTLSFVMAGDFIMNYAGAQIFTVATSGNLNASGTIAESGVLLTDTYLDLADTFGGDVSGTYDNLLIKNTQGLDAGNITTGTFNAARIPTLDAGNITGTFNAASIPTLDYHNITNIPSCGANTYLKYDGSDLFCVAVTNALISGENITSGTIDIARLPSLVNKTTLAYQNITGIPSCTDTEFLQFNATGMFCVEPIGAGFDSTNIAFYNKTNTWAEEQVFDEWINVTKGIKFTSNTSYIAREGVGTNISIDSLGNLIINLG